MLCQVHHQDIKDTSKTSLCFQFDGNCLMEFRAAVERARDEYPLPEGKQFLMCSELSPFFVKEEEDEGKGSLDFNLKYNHLKIQYLFDKYVKLTDDLLVVNIKALYWAGHRNYVRVPAGFVCDLESVPRIPLIHSCFAYTSAYGGVVHDYLYRKDSQPNVTRKIADRVYLEVMKARGNGIFRRWGKYLAVRLFGWMAYGKLKVGDGIEKISDRGKVKGKSSWL